MPSKSDLPTTSGSSFVPGQTVRAGEITVRGTVSTTTAPVGMRVVVTKKSEGTIKLRYAPKEPRVEFHNTSD